ncbi:MAG: DNA ligase-associated DEXH box helicase, partial [Geminicoccaceae bacterium]|nr:DNA ligase-associated DEXH box helicase [Geminicoccaceae bacterium]
EVLECQAALDANYLGAQDTPPLREGSLDVLAQHVLGMAVAEPFQADALYAEVTTAAPYAALDRADFDRVVDFVATGGYALRQYERYRRLEQGPDGLWHLTDRRLVRGYRMNIGTIVEAPVMRVRLGGGRGRGRSLGEIEEYFVSMLTPGDSFLFAGRVLAFEGIRQNEVIASLAKGAREPKIPAYAGGRLPLTSQLAHRVRRLLAEPAHWPALPAPVREWLELQRRHSALVAADELLVESFWRAGRHFLVAYSFVGRNAHQTLGMLLTRRLQRMGARPIGFVASDYCIATWSLGECHDIEALFDVDMLGDDLEEWIAESSMVKRIFRNCAVVAGLIERRHPGQEKTGRQVTFNADLIYDVLRKHEPDHVLLKAARAEAAAGLTDIRRLADLLTSVQGRIRHRRLDRISPFAVSIVAGIGKERVDAGDLDQTLDELTAELVAEALAEPA